MNKLNTDNRGRTDSLKKRYAYKLATNLVGLAISFVTMGIIPRGLGPKAYGDFNYLNSFFAQIAQFLDMGSLGFYTKISKRPGEHGLLLFYFYYTATYSFITLFFVFVIGGTSIKTQLWPGQVMFYVYLTLLLIILQRIVNLLSLMGDAYGLTVSTELAGMVQRILGMFLLVWLFFSQNLNLTKFYFYNYTIFLFSGFAFIWILSRSNYFHKFDWLMSWAKIKSYLKEYYAYTHPLVVYNFIGLIAGLLDRWLLQVFGGSREQGYFSLSDRIGSICFMFTSAMTPLLLREFSITFEKKAIGEMAMLYRRYIPLFYSIAAYFAVFMAVQAEKITYIIGGKQFIKATSAVIIMSFYPIHQTYGQLGGSVYYATGRTSLYRNIGIFFLLIGLPVTYFLIAPGDKMGLNSGATGLAIKMVAIQFIHVNVLLHFNAKFLKISFWREISHQLLSIGCFMSIAWISAMVVDYSASVYSNVLLRLIISGVLYTLIVLCVAFFQPKLFGIEKKDLKEIFHKFIFKLNT